LRDSALGIAKKPQEKARQQEWDHGPEGIREPSNEQRREDQRQCVEISVTHHERPENYSAAESTADCNLTATKIGAYERRISQTLHP
jgi:hypothetical protein